MDLFEPTFQGKALESTKRVGIIVSACVAAAATGVVVVAAIAKWRQSEAESILLKNSLRDVQDVLSDCYDKIQEIEEHLPLNTFEPGIVMMSHQPSAHPSISN